MRKVTKLKFKGDTARPSYENRKRKVDDKFESSEGNQDALSSTEEVHEAEDKFEPQTGTGRLTSSSTTIHGHFTKFMDEIAPGDASELSTQSMRLQ
jgi:hypothetical protein